MSRIPDFRDRKQKEEKEEEMATLKSIHGSKPNVRKDYLEEQALLQKESRDIDNPIDQTLFDEAKQKEYLRKNPHLEEDCMKNAKDCVTDAWKWAFPTKSNNTIEYDYNIAKKKNGGKKSRKSHNSKKQRKSKKSHTTIRSKRSRR